MKIACFQYYHAQIHAIAQSGQTCVVTFSDYGNSEEVLMSDIRPLPATAWVGIDIYAI